MKNEQVAIIDLGTNTFHLLLAEIDERDHYIIKGKYKEPVQLGEGGINSGKIMPDPYKRGIKALRLFRTIIDNAGVSKIFAYATSAIRSASNGNDFILSAKEQAGVHIKTINGNEEAALIYEGIKNGIRLPFNDSTLLIDIGGGSVEFIVAHEGRVELLRSINIGCARLLDKIKPSNPIKPKEIAEVYRLFDKELSGLIKELKEFRLSMLVGASGTFETLATLVAYQQKDKISIQNLNGFQFGRKEFEWMHSRLLHSTRQERDKMQGMDALRSEMIVMGSCLINYILTSLEIEQCLTSTHALKEGILNRYIREKKIKINQYVGHLEYDIRARSVLNLALKVHYEPDHTLKVSELCTNIWTALRDLIPCNTPTDKEMLQYAAILHDIGKFIHVSGHHKHGQYIVANSNLSGFVPSEMMIIGNIIRYHRRSFPKPEHLGINLLSEKDKKAVAILAGILRIGDNLDRGHRGFVTDIKINISEDKITMTIFAAHEVEMEMMFAKENAALLEMMLGKEIIFING